MKKHSRSMEKTKRKAAHLEQPSRSFLNLYFPAAVLLGKELLILLHLGFLDLNSLNLTSLQRLLDALLGQFGRICNIDSLELRITLEAIGSDCLKSLGSDLESLKLLAV